MNERQITNQIVKYCRENGIFYLYIPNDKAHFRNVPSVKGAPDLIIILPHGKTLWIEVKAPVTGRMRPWQKEFHEKLREKGHYIAVVKSLEEFITHYQKAISEDPLSSRQ